MTNLGSGPQILPWLKLLDWHPMPTIVLTSDLIVLFANRASRQILGQPHMSDNRHVMALPITWQDGKMDEFYDKLSRSFDRPLGHDSIDKPSVSSFRVRVDQDPSNVLTTTLLVSTTRDQDIPYQILSFEGIQPQHESNHYTDSEVSAVQLHDQGAAGIWSPSSSSLLSTRSLRKLDDLRDSISRLKDAVYSNEERAGFLLSADNKFSYPNCIAGSDVEPVKIDDLEEFFSKWNVWDQHFTNRILLSEYPSIRLNRERVKFRDCRYGLEEQGKRTIIEVSGDPLYDKDTGEYLGGVCWIDNLGSYAEVAATDLKIGLADFRNVCERLPHLIWTVDVGGQADYLSQAWYDFTGLDEAQSPGLAFQSAIHPEDTQVIWAGFSQACADNSEVSCEVRYKRFDGKWRWMSVRARALRALNGTILKWYGTSTDIHTLVVERLRAEIRQSQLMKMLSVANIGLFDVSPEGQITVQEGKVEWVCDGRVCQSNKLDAVNETDAKTLNDFLIQAARGDKESIVFEGQIDNRWYKCRLMSGSDFDTERSSLREVIGCSVDVTEDHERAALNTESSRLMQEATMEIQKSQMKTDFLAHISHEIRTPIVGIMGIADMLADTRLDDEQEDCVENVRLSASNLLTIVNDILDLSKIDAGQLRFETVSFDLYPVVNQVQKLLSPIAGKKNIDLFHRGNTEKLDLCSDPGRVKQILINLVSNALKFTSEGFVCVHIEKQAANVRIMVEDSGDGIDVETLKKLFRPFTQGDASTARRHGGTGLGLTISQNLAHGLGGTLELESVVGQGTKAILILPQEVNAINMADGEFSMDSVNSSERLIRQSPSIQLVDSTASSKYSHSLSLGEDQDTTASEPFVLVVDDNPVNLKIAIALTRRLGYNAQAMWNGKEALDFLERTSALPVCVLMDCQMPLIDGYEATKRLRTEDKYRRLKHVPVIALTASTIPGDREKCQASGMNDYLSKPLRKESLATMLKKWVSSCQPAQHEESQPADV